MSTEQSERSDVRAPAPPVKVKPWEVDVKVRAGSRLTAAKVGNLVKGHEYVADVQRAGDPFTAPGTNDTNYYWVHITGPGVTGWVTSVYLEGGRNNYPHPHVQPVVPDRDEWNPPT